MPSQHQQGKRRANPYALFLMWHRGKPLEEPLRKRRLSNASGLPLGASMEKRLVMITNITKNHGLVRITKSFPCHRKKLQRHGHSFVNPMGEN
ncbi:MAG: hypothetical protein C0514_00110 [Candidatus Puniceispirillum sp.]|nr:hypothetical protein [Candidatus Puniceispirillum sp.]